MDSYRSCDNSSLFQMKMCLCTSSYNVPPSACINLDGIRSTLGTFNFSVSDSTFKRLDLGGVWHFLQNYFDNI